MSLCHIEPGGPLRPRKDPHTQRMQRAGGTRPLFVVGAIAFVIFVQALADYIDCISTPTAQAVGATNKQANPKLASQP